MTIYNDAVYFECRKCLKKVAAKILREIVFKKYYKRIGFTKKDTYYLFVKVKKEDLILFATKLIKTYLITMNSFFKKKAFKTVKNPDKGDIKSTTVAHPKTIFNLLKPITQSNIIT